VHLPRGRVEFPACQRQLVFEQLYLALKLRYLAVVFGDTTFQLTFRDPRPPPLEP
jgi:hypothetical protein